MDFKCEQCKKVVNKVYRSDCFKRDFFVCKDCKEKESGY